MLFHTLRITDSEGIRDIQWLATNAHSCESTRTASAIIRRTQSQSEYIITVTVKPSTQVLISVDMCVQPPRTPEYSAQVTRGVRLPAPVATAQLSACNQSLTDWLSTRLATHSITLPPRLFDAGMRYNTVYLTFTVVIILSLILLKRLTVVRAT